MIVEALSSMSMNFISALFSGFEIISLPYDVISVLYKFFCYSVWIIGADVLSLIFSSITFWLTFRTGIGLVVWVYKLIPFIG